MLNKKNTRNNVKKEIAADQTIFSSVYSSHISTKQQKNIFLMLLIVSLFGHIASGIGNYFRDEKVILLPTNAKYQMWIKNSKVSEEYVREIAYFFMDLFLNISPNNYLYNTDVILKYTSPGNAFEQMKVYLLNRNQEFKNLGVSTNFFPKAVSVQIKEVNAIPKELEIEAIVEGSLVVYQDNIRKEHFSKTYKVSFSYKYGLMLLKEFNEYSPQAQTINSPLLKAIVKESDANQENSKESNNENK